MKLEDMPYLAPSICVVCQTKPPEVKWVDTNYNFECGVPTPITGRKYLCEICLQDAAKLLGYVPVKAVEDAEREKKEAEGNLKALKGAFGSLMQGFEQAATHIEVPVEAPVSPPKKRGRPKKVV